MKKIMEFLSGKKTYITMAAAFVCGGLEAAGVHVPEYVYVMLASLGIVFTRNAIKKGE